MILWLYLGVEEGETGVFSKHMVLLEKMRRDLDMDENDCFYSVNGIECYTKKCILCCVLLIIIIVKFYVYFYHN